MHSRNVQVYYMVCLHISFDNKIQLQDATGCFYMTLPIFTCISSSMCHLQGLACCVFIIMSNFFVIQSKYIATLLQFLFGRSQGRQLDHESLEVKKITRIDWHSCHRAPDIMEQEHKSWAAKIMPVKKCSVFTDFLRSYFNGW